MLLTRPQILFKFQQFFVWFLFWDPIQEPTWLASFFKKTTQLWVMNGLEVSRAVARKIKIKKSSKDSQVAAVAQVKSKCGPA